MRTCKTCGRYRELHPRMFGDTGPRYCELVLVEDVHSGEGTVAYEADTPYPRTLSNNRRWIHASRAGELIR